MDVEEGLEDRVRVLEARMASTLAGALGIQFVSIHRAELVATMPVDSRTKQPFGILHGGASMALAETLASIGSWVNIDDSQSIAVGIEINGSHIRPAERGTVTGVAKPVRLGRRIHVWEVNISNDRNVQICTCRCTVAILRKTEVEERSGGGGSTQRH